MLEEKLRIYNTIYLPPKNGKEGFYATTISKSDAQEFNCEKFFRCKLRIKETNYNNEVLEIFLTREDIERDFSASYIVIGEDKIRNFLEDM